MLVQSNGPKGLHKYQRTHKSVQRHIQVSDPTPLSNHKRQVVTSVERRASTRQREAGQPGLVCVQAAQAASTPGEDHRRPRKGGGQMATSLGRPS